MKRIVVCVLSFSAFIGGLLATAWLLGHLNPNFDEFAIRQKLRHLESNIDEYDTFFLGSSRVYHQISPALFDQITREAGVPTKSLNLGVDGLFPPEDSYVAEYIASLRPKNLRWVFVEVSMFLPDWAEKNSDSPRAVYWHDWTRTSMAVRDILQQTGKFEWKKRNKKWGKWQDGLRRCSLHIQMFARNITNLGRGRGMLADFLTGKKSKLGEGMGRARDGYSPLAPPTEKEAVALKDYDKLFTLRTEKPVEYKALSPVGQENLDRTLKTVRKMGATPVLIVSPVLTRTFLVPRKPSKELYLDFADIHTWPELYRKENLFDSGHLSKPGAELYTRYIAERWLATYGPQKAERTGAGKATTSALDVRPLTP